MRPGDHGADPWEGTEPERPIDIEALRADDEFVEALVAGVVRRPGEGPATSRDPDAELRSMLSAWVLDVRPETVTAVEDAEDTVPVPASTAVVPARPEPAHSGPVPHARTAAGRGRQWRPPRYLRRAAAAAAMVALLGSGLAVSAWEAQPGGTLWPMAKVFYAEHARSVQAAADVTTGISRARTALREGRTGEAAEEIRAVRATLDQVAPAQGHDALDQLQLQLSDQLATVDPMAATTLYRPPAGPGPAAAGAAAPLAITPAPLTDRAAGDTPLPATGSGGPVVAAVPDPVVAPVPPVLNPPATAGQPSPDPAAGGTTTTTSPDAAGTGGSGTGSPNTGAPATTDPPTAPPTVPPTVDPQPVDPVPTGAGTGTTEPGATVPAATGTTPDGSTLPAAAANPTAAGAAAAGYAPATPSGPAAADTAAPAGGSSTGQSLLGTVTNAAADTVSTVGSALGS